MTHVTPQLPVVEVAEWKSVDLPKLVLDPMDQRLARSVSGATGQRIVIEELRSGLRISARSWVGVVRFSAFELRIVPKLVGSQLDLVRLIDFATGLDALKRHPAVRQFEGGGESLLDLIALLLAEACERLARAGLLADYREQEDDLPVIRGRLLVAKQALRRLGRVDRLECRFDEHGTDIPENQLLLAALSICAPRVLHPLVGLRVRRVLNVFAEACTPEGLDLRLMREDLQYNRMNEHYREAHSLAWLILDGLGVQDIFDGSSHRCFAFLLDMNRLFEDFVTRWLGRSLHQHGYRVIPQRRDQMILWNADLGCQHSCVIPDIQIEHRDQPERMVPVDAKYKLYEHRQLSPADIYQTFLYAFAYGQKHFGLPTAILLYPSSSSGAGTIRLHVRTGEGRSHAALRGLGLHIPTALSEAENRTNGPMTKCILDVLQEVFYPA